MEKLTPKLVRSDSRGTLTHITTFNGIDLNKFELREGHLVGGHYHKLTHEIFHVVQGKISVFSAHKNDTEATIKEFNTGDSFVIDPYEWHYVEAVEDSILIVLLDPPYDHETPDIFEGSSLNGE